MSDPAGLISEARIVRTFHPSIHVPDLAQAEAWFERVFGRKSVSLTTILKSTPNYPTEYSSFTVIQDVMLDLIDPGKHFVSGVQRYPLVSSPELKGIGWYADGIADLYHQLRQNGVRSMNLWNEIVEGDDPPRSPDGNVVTYFTVPADSGLQYQFMRDGPFPIDPRTKPGWTLPPVAEGDPLGIERCGGHVILTRNADRARHFFVAALGGQVMADRRNHVFGGRGVVVALADALFEILVPDAGSDVDNELAGDGDRYHAMAWKVGDLDRAARHLESQGVGFHSVSDATIVTDPATSFGIPWIFTTSDDPT